MHGAFEAQLLLQVEAGTDNDFEIIITDCLNPRTEQNTPLLGIHNMSFDPCDGVTLDLLSNRTLRIKNISPNKNAYIVRVCFQSVSNYDFSVVKYKITRGGPKNIRLINVMLKF
jgi:hypothetical protein